MTDRDIAQLVTLLQRFRDMYVWDKHEITSRGTLKEQAIATTLNAVRGARKGDYLYSCRTLETTP